MHVVIGHVTRMLLVPIYLQTAEIIQAEEGVSVTKVLLVTASVSANQFGRVLLGQKPVAIMPAVSFAMRFINVYVIRVII